MTVKRVRAKSATSARNKCRGPETVVVKTNRIPGTKVKGGLYTYQVTTRRRKK